MNAADNRLAHDARDAFRTLATVPISEGRRGEKEQAAFLELRRVVKRQQKRIKELSDALALTGPAKGTAWHGGNESHG